MKKLMICWWGKAKHFPDLQWVNTINFIERHQIQSEHQLIVEDWITKIMDENIYMDRKTATMRVERLLRETIIE